MRFRVSFLRAKVEKLRIKSVESEREPNVRICLSYVGVCSEGSELETWGAIGGRLS